MNILLHTLIFVHIVTFLYFCFFLPSSLVFIFYLLVRSIEWLILCFLLLVLILLFLCCFFEFWALLLVSFMPLRKQTVKLCHGKGKRVKNKTPGGSKAVHDSEGFVFLYCWSWPENWTIWDGSLKDLQVVWDKFFQVMKIMYSFRLRENY